MKNYFQISSLASLLIAFVGFTFGCAEKGHQSQNPMLPSSVPAPLPAPQPSRNVAGTSDSGGGDWFVQPLPILKFVFPEDGGIVEGVRFQRIVLRPCSKEDSRPTDPKGEPVIYFPGKNFEAVKVQASYNNLVCSYGVVERDPVRALQVLVNNDDTNRDHEFGGWIMHSKVYGGPMAVGNFLLNARSDKHVTIFGQAGLLNIDLEQHFWVAPVFAANSGDVIYVPSEIQPSPKAYFGNNPNGNWRIILPIAYAPSDIALQNLSDALHAAHQEKNPAVLDLLNPINLPKGFPDGFSEPWVTVAQIWSTLERTSEDLSLREKLFKTYSLPLKAEEQHSYAELKSLSDIFNFKFSPTIALDDIHHAAFHESGHRVDFFLPLLNPTWRVVADMIHEMTHAIQSNEGDNPDEKRFLNEMEAHTNERAYLKRLSEKYDVLKTLIPLYNYIVAAGVPRVAFVSSIVSPVKTPLCTSVIRSYKIDRTKVSSKLLHQYGCGTE